VFYFIVLFHDVQTPEISLNNAGNDRLQRNKILFYFRRSHIV